jgi:DNA replication protein
MALENRTTDDLVRIISSGGGLEMVSAHRTVDDLVRIAAAAARSGARVKLLGVGHRTVDDLVRVAASGKGMVTFGDAA